MKLKNLLRVVLPILVLQACVSTPSLDETASKLNVYPDNRVFFSSSERLQAWSNDNNILALRIKDRLINAKDIESVSVVDLRTTPKPLRVRVHLRSGEDIVDDVVNWGYGVDWAACTPARTCKYLARPYREHQLGAVDFPGFPKLLSTLAVIDIEREVERLVQWKRPSREADIRVRQDAGAILPDRVSTTSLTFSASFQVPDTKAMVEAEMKVATAIANCVSERNAADAQAERNDEAAFLRSNPSPDDVRRRAAAKAMRPRNFMTSWNEPECVRKYRR